MERTPQCEAACIPRCFILGDLVPARLSGHPPENKAAAQSRRVHSEMGFCFGLCACCLCAQWYVQRPASGGEGPAWSGPAGGLRSGWAL